MARRGYPWRLAVVTGAASGIGRRFCQELAAAGCGLVLVDRAPMGDTLALLPGKDAAHHFTLTLDLTAADADLTLARWLDERGLQPDLLVNNAGIFDFCAVTDLSRERLDVYVDLHMRAVTHLSRTMAMRMASAGGGAILNMSSMSCWMPMPGIAMYSATKAYIRVFSRALRLEVADSGVSVTVACPGGIATDLFGLPRNLQRLGVRVGALATPERFVRGALRAVSNGKPQYINGLLNRLAIVGAGITPEWMRRLVKSQILNRYGRKQSRPAVTL